MSEMFSMALPGVKQTAGWIVIGPEWNIFTDKSQMKLILLEALGALVLLLLIVWWTMFSGRRRGERDEDDGG